MDGYNNVKEQLFYETLHAYRKYMDIADIYDEWSVQCQISHARFSALYCVIESVPGLEDEYQVFKSDVLTVLGKTGAELKNSDIEALSDAIYKVLGDRR